MHPKIWSNQLGLQGEQKSFREELISTLDYCPGGSRRHYGILTTLDLLFVQSPAIAFDFVKPSVHIYCVLAKPWCCKSAITI